MNKIKILLVGVIAVLLGFYWNTVPASAEDDAKPVWGPEQHLKDCDGNGCLEMGWKINVKSSVGFILTYVTITSSGGTLNAGVDGGALECWNDAGDVKWSKTGAQTNLDRNDYQSWTPNLVLPSTPRVTCRWFFNSQFYGSPPIPGCVKVTAWHLDRDTGC